MSLWSMMDSTATGILPAIGKDAAGGTTQDFTIGNPGVTVLFSGLCCSYQEASPSVQQIYAQRGQNVTSTLLFAQDPNIAPNVLITCQRGRIGDTLDLLVVGERDPIQMGQTWVWPVDCTRWRGPAIGGA